MSPSASHLTAPVAVVALKGLVDGRTSFGTQRTTRDRRDVRANVIKIRAADDATAHVGGEGRESQRHGRLLNPCIPNLPRAKAEDETIRPAFPKGGVAQARV